MQKSSSKNSLEDQQPLKKSSSLQNVSNNTRATGSKSKIPTPLSSSDKAKYKSEQNLGKNHRKTIEKPLAKVRKKPDALPRPAIRDARLENLLIDEDDASNNSAAAIPPSGVKNKQLEAMENALVEVKVKVGEKKKMIAMLVEEVAKMKRIFEKLVDLENQKKKQVAQASNDPTEEVICKLGYREKFSLNCTFCHCFLQQ